MSVPRTKRTDATSVLDASAVLAYFRGEPGAEQVEEALVTGAAIGAANWAEVLSRLAGVGEDPESVSRQVEQHGLAGGSLTVMAVTAADAVQIAALYRSTRQHGLSLADRACIVLGRRLGLPVLTADRAWGGLDLQAAVKVIR